MLVFFYVGVRPRFGPGPNTAIPVAVVFWFGGYLPFLLGGKLLGIFSTGLLVMWGIVGLEEVIIAALVGGWVYKEAQLLL